MWRKKSVLESIKYRVSENKWGMGFSPSSLDGVCALKSR